VQVVVHLFCFVVEVVAVAVTLAKLVLSVQVVVILARIWVYLDHLRDRQDRATRFESSRHAREIFQE